MEPLVSRLPSALLLKTSFCFLAFLSLFFYPTNSLFAGSTPLITIGDGTDSTSTAILLPPGSSATSSNAFTLRRGLDSAGLTWSTSTSAADNNWVAITYGNGLFVAIANSGTGNRVMTSPDGINWTIQTSAADYSWNAVTYGGGLFVAVAESGTGNRVMTSPDGITWTLRNTPVDNSWRGITYGNGTFVAVAYTGTGNRVMRSNNGITWATSTSAADNQWLSVTYGNGLFVAVAQSGGTNCVMTSPDGITWTVRTAPNNNGWASVTYGNGLFVAVAISGVGNRVMTSPDGINWTARTSAADNNWAGVTYGNGLFVAVAYTGSGNRVMVSPDGINWTTKNTIDNSWYGVVYGNGMFVSSAYTGAGDRIMTSGSLININQVVVSLNSEPKNNGEEWTLRTTPLENGWISVTYGNGMFVAVAATTSTNSVMTSPDGITWTVRTAPASAIGWNSVTYGNGLFVAVGSGNGTSTMTSPDGITWTARATPSNNSWNSVTYGNGLFVAVSSSVSGSDVMTSSDGITWTGVAGAANNQWQEVVYGNGLFVAVANTGTGNRVMRSTDGITWATSSSAADNSWTSVTYGNGLFVAVADTGTGNRVMTSPDGITWTIRTSAANDPWSAVTYGNGLFVAIKSWSGTNRVMTSPDGITWTTRTAAADHQWYGLTYGNGVFVAVSDTQFGTVGSRVMTSSSFSGDATLLPGLTNNGTVWATSTSPANNAWYAITYGNGLFVAAACGVATSSTCEGLNVGSRIMTSPDGITWTLRTTPGNNSIRGITYGKGLFVAVGGDATIITSPDGVNWTSRTNPTPANPMLSVTYGNGLFVAVAITGTGNRVITSPDGINWTARTSAADNQWNSVTYGNGLFVAVASSGSGNRVMTSPDGMTWTTRAITDGSYSAVTYGNGLFVIAQVGNFFMTSPDGITWTSRTVPNSLWNSVTYGNGLFVAVGGAGAVITSRDGVTWTAQSSANNNDYYGLAYGNGTFVAVSWNGAGNRIMRSTSGFGGVIPQDKILNPTFAVTPADNNWSSVTYGNGLFVAVASSGTGNRVMTSPDGITWTARTSAADNTWSGVTYGNGLFVAVANNAATTTTVMTSPDGITWTPRSGIGSIQWTSVTYGNGLFVAVATNAATTTSVMTSPDGINWTPRSGMNTSLSSVTYGNGLFVAVCSGGFNCPGMTSPDGINWIPRTLVSGYWTAVTYGAGQFVAVASTISGIMTSPDGITWTPRTAPDSSGGWQTITYGDGIFLALRNPGGAMTSPDGTNWTGRATALTNSWTSAIYANGVFAAVSNSGTGNRAILLDYVSQSNYTSASYQGVSLVEITNDAGNVVYGSVSLPSRNLISIPITNSINVSDVPTQYRIRITPKIHGDQIDSATEPYVVRSEVQSLEFSQGTAVAVDSGDAAGVPVIIDNYSSFNTSNTSVWKSIPQVPSNTWADITYGNGIFVAVAQTGDAERIMTSPDGVTWTLRQGPANMMWRGVTYGNGLFVAVACGMGTNCNNTTSGVATSPDGITWTTRTTPSAAWGSVAFGNGLFVAVAYNNQTSIVSADGVNWTTVRLQTNNAWTSVTYGNGLFVAVADYGTDNHLMTSVDGVTWTLRSVSASNWQSVTYGNGRFVAVGEAGALMSSLDGVTWTSLVSPVNNSWFGVKYGGGYFVAVAQSGTNRIMRSVDGITWEVVSTKVSDSVDWSAVTYGKGVFVAAGAGAILNSYKDKGAPQSNKISLTFPISVAYDVSRVLVLQNTSSIVHRPADGVTYATGTMIGTSKVVCSQLIAYSFKYTCDISQNIYNGTPYYFKIFTADNNLNYSDGVEPELPIIPGDSTTIADGVDPPSITLVPGSSATTSNIFTVQTSAGTDVIQSVTLDLATGTATSTSLIEITNDAGNIVYGSVANPATDTPTILLSNNTLTANTSLVPYRVRVTPKSHTNMPVTPGDLYTFTSVVTAFESSKLIHVLDDAPGTVLTIDNKSLSHNGLLNWQLTPSAQDGSGWESVAYGNGLFVAVRSRVGTSPDGITWTDRGTTPNTMYGITYGKGLFVAVGQNTIITSPDGITWTTRSGAAGATWEAVTYGNGLFVAVANTSGNCAIDNRCVITSPDGIAWTQRITPLLNLGGIAYGNGLFVAISRPSSCSSLCIMTSPDGISWKSRSGFTQGVPTSVAYGNGVFVVVTETAGSATSIMTSTDGITWTSRQAAAANDWQSVTWTGSLFIAVASSGTGNRIMTSPDGITWASESSPSDISWETVTSGGGKIVALAYAGVGNQAMYTRGLYAVASSTQITLSYRIPASLSDVSSLLILSSTSPITLPPTEGQSYATSSTIGGSTVVCSSTVVSSSTYSCTVTSLSNGTPYFLKMYLKDQSGNWSIGEEPEYNPIVPGVNTLTVGNGFASSTTIAPGASATTSNAFTFQMSASTDIIQSVTLDLGVGSATSTSLIEITNDAGNTVYGSVANPTTDTPTILLSNNTLTANTSLTQYRVRVTPKTHAQLASENKLYVVQSRITQVDTTSSKVTNLDSTPSLFIDNESPAQVKSQGGSVWTSRVSAANNQWKSITYGNGLFVAVANSGTGNRVMRSTDGITWATSTTPVNNNWLAVAYGNGVFVATADSGNGNRVMRSTDGITWATSTTPANNVWGGVTYGNGLFVAVSYTAIVNNIMTSPDGITWTIRTGPTTDMWTDVTYSDGLFIAVGNNTIMTSPDGITWTSRTSPANNTWLGVTYGNGLFVAVAQSGAGNRVMTSPDGINWTIQAAAAYNAWQSVTYGNGLFVAVALSGTGNRVMTSPDGITWTAQTSAADNVWNDVVYGNGMFVAVACGVTSQNCNTGAGNRVMTSTAYTATTSQITLPYFTPSNPDLSSIIVLFSTSTITAVPTDGQSYATSSTIGASTVICSYAVATSTSYTCTATGLTNGVPSYFKVFAKDTSGNWSVGTNLINNPVTPGSASVILDTGNDPPPVELAPGSGATTTNTFTLKTTSGTDIIQSVTLELNPGSATTTSLIEITNDAGSTVYGSVANPVTDTPTILLSNNTLTANTVLTQYRVRVTPKSHSNIPSGSRYTFNCKIKLLKTTAAAVSGEDTAPTVVLNRIPPNTAASAFPLSDVYLNKINIKYTNATTSNITQTLVLRSASPAVDTPVDGTTYIVGNTIGASTVVCVQGSPSLTEKVCEYQNPTRGSRFYFTIFNRDSQGNYSAPKNVGSGVLPYVSPRAIFIEFESLNGGTATTTGGNNQNGGGTGGTGTTTTATTTTSTSTPGQGGGGGDLGYSSSKNIFAGLRFFKGSFANFLTGIMTGGAEGSYASTKVEVPTQSQNSCPVTLFGGCIIKNIPFMGK